MNANPPKKSPATVRNEPAEDLEHQIRLRSYELYKARGRQDGHELDDWLQAEAELTEKQALPIAA